jgi:hypothetical protein
MESRGKFSGNRGTAVYVPVESKPKRTLLRNDSGMTLKVMGPSSEEVYVFNPGQTLSVSTNDVDYLLSIKSGAGCVGCGGNSAASKFVRVEG